MSPFGTRIPPALVLVTLAMSAACRSGDVLYAAPDAAPGDARRPDAPGEAGAVTNEPDLLLRFDFEEGTGQTTREMTEDRPVSEFVNGVTWTQDVPPPLTGISTHAVTIDGDRYLLAARDLREVFSGSLSVSVWIRSTDSGQSQDPEASPGLLRPYDGVMQYWGALDDEGRIGIVFPDARCVSPVRVNDGRWHHVVVGHAFGGELRTYVDGVLAPPAFSQPSAEKHSLREYLRGVGGRSFRGNFDDLRIYGHLLDAEEVQNLFQGRNADGTAAGS